MNVYDYLLEGKPDASPALLMLQGEKSYGELRSAARAVARFIVESGGVKGDRAIVLAENGPFWVAAYLGVLRAGLVCVPLSPTLPAAELAEIMTLTEPRFLFVDRKTAAKSQPTAGQVIVVNDTHSCFHDLPNAGNAVFPPTNPDDLAALMFTSGSTGKPRGVMVSHRNIIANTDSIITYLSLTAGDRIMTVLPFHYCFGTSLLHTHLRVGGSLVLDARFMYPQAILQRMRQTECTGFAGVPSHYQILLRKSSLARTTFPLLRYVQQAGGPLAPTFIRELRQALPGKQVFIMYGQTEATARLSYLPPEYLDSKLGSIGKGIPGVTLSVMNELGREAAPGETGEIVASGENVALGYWRAPGESAECFRDGKLYTGDLATVDSDGFIYIVDRAKDFLKCGGKRVSCRHLENILLEHGELLEASIVGVPDQVLGEVAVAFIVPRNSKSSITADQLRLYCRQHIPPPFVPQQFVMLPSLPKNSSGKVLKTLLRTNAVSSGD